MRHLSILYLRPRAVWLAPVLVALLAAVSLIYAHSAHAAQPFDWRIESSVSAGPAVISGATNYRLTNIKSQKVIAYGKRDYGINLVWQTLAGQQNIRFDKVGGGPVRYGDFVAIQVDGGGYLHYKTRDHGINLVWSAEPVYEWQIHGGTYGLPVGVGFDVALQNTEIYKYMVYGKRDVGINLVWH